MESTSPSKIIPGSPEWLEWRKGDKGDALCSTDIARILGMPYFGSTARDVCLEKKGEADDVVVTPFMIRGKKLEDALGCAYAMKTNKRLVPEYCAEHPELKWMRATPDGKVVYENKHVQIKTHVHWVAHEYGDQGTDDIPDHELVQVTHELAVTGHDSVDLVVLFASEEVFDLLVHLVDTHMDNQEIASYILDKLDFRIYTVYRDKELERDLIAAETEFREKYLLTGEIPPDYAVMQNRKTVRIATTGEEAFIEDFKQVWLNRERANRRLEVIRDKVKLIIGEDKGIMRGKDEKITYNKPKDGVTSITDWGKVRESLSIDKQDWLDAISGSSEIVPVIKTRRLSLPWRVWNKEL